MPPNKGPIKKGSKPQYVQTRGGKVLNKNPRTRPATGPAGPRGNTGPTGPRGNTTTTGTRRSQTINRAAARKMAKEQRALRKIRQAERTTKPLTNARLRKMGGEPVHSAPGRPLRLIDPITEAGRRRIAAGERQQQADIRQTIREADKTLNRKGRRQLRKRESAIETLRSLGGLVDQQSKVQAAGERQTARFDKKVKKQLDNATMAETPTGERAWKGGNKGPAAPKAKDLSKLAKDINKLVLGAAPPAPGFRKPKDVAKYNAAMKKSTASPTPKNLIRTAGLGSPEKVASTARLAETPVLVGEVLASDPKQVPRLAKDTVKATVGIPSGLYRIATNPKSSTKGIIEDYKRRYGPLLAGDEKAFKARMKKEGVAPEVFDTVAAASVAGATIGRGAQVVARSGKLGSKAQRAATKVRPLRASGGERGVVPREPSKNFFKNVGREGVDAVRAKRQKAQVKRGSADAVKVEAQSRGEVTHLTDFFRERAQTKLVNRAGGIAHATLKSRQNRELFSLRDSTRAHLARLSKAERDGIKYAASFGIRTPEQGRKMLTRLRDRIVTERAAREAKGEKLIILNEELSHIDRLIANADQVFTPNLRNFIKVEGNRSRRLGMGDPALVNEQMLRRIHMPAAELLGVDKLPARTSVKIGEKSYSTLGERPSHIANRVKAGRDATPDLQNLTENLKPGKPGIKIEDEYIRLVDPQTRETVGWRGKLPGSKVVVQRDKTGKPIGAMRVMIENGKPTIVEIAVDSAHRGKGVGSALVRYAHEHGLPMNDLKDNAFTEAGAALEHKLRSEHTPGLTVREYSPAPVAKSESAVQYARRVRQAMKKEGLGAPMYFPSEEIPRTPFAAFAKGGTKAVAGDKAYTGALMKTGREAWQPDVLIRGMARNIKRQINWNLVANTVNENVFEWTKAKKYTARQLEREIRDRGINPDSVVLWNPRLMERAQVRTTEAANLADNADPTLLDSTLSSAFSGSAREVGDFLAHPEQFEGTGWQLVPKKVYDEIMGTVKAGKVAEGKVARAYDITKGKVSRVLLGNPAWLGFQVGSNALMTALSGTTPLDLLRSRKFWKSFPPEHREAAEAIFGVHGWYDNQRHLGSTANGRFVDAYRTLKLTPFYQGAHRLNPFDAFFKADNAQNNFFRRAGMYSALKREARSRLGESATGMVDTQGKITKILSKGDIEEVMRDMTKNRALMEKHAQFVDDFWGNWTTYSTAERHVWSRIPMFYGFLRFSTRLAFYTMPVKHPIMSSILLQIGRLEKDEIEQIFGSRGGEVPPWEYGNFYGSGLGFGESPKPNEKVNRLPLVRLVPFFNAVQFGERGTGAIAGSLSFPISESLNLLAGKNVALDQLYNVGGNTKRIQNSKDLGIEDQAKIALADVLNLSPYYRALAKSGIPGVVKPLRGKQGSDSSLIFPSPIKYKREDAIARNKRRIAEQNRPGFAGNLREGLLPQFGSSGEPQLASARDFKQGRTKKPKETKYEWQKLLGSGGGKKKFNWQKQLNGGRKKDQYEWQKLLSGD